RAGRAPPQPRQHLVHRHRNPLRLDEDAAVALVSHPADDADGRRRGARRRAVGHPLHATAHPSPYALSLHHKLLDTKIPSVYLYKSTAPAPPPRRDFDFELENTQGASPA